MSEKKVNHGAVESNAQAITSISDDIVFFENVTPDCKSTITAKSSALVAIGESQSTMKSLSVDLKNESKNIKSIGAAFKDYDEAIKLLVKNI